MLRFGGSADAARAVREQGQALSTYLANLCASVPSWRVTYVLRDGTRVNAELTSARVAGDWEAVWAFPVATMHDAADEDVLLLTSADVNVTAPLDPVALDRVEFKQ